MAVASQVETFVALRMEMDSWRWSDVPILIRAGKCLARTATEVMVRFRIPPQRLIAGQSMDHSHNYIRIRFNPEEVIALGVAVRKEGERDDLQPVELTVSRTAVDEVPPYARLLQSAMAGDTSLFSAPTPSKHSGKSSSRYSATRRRFTHMSRGPGGLARPTVF